MSTLAQNRDFIFVDKDTKLDTLLGLKENLTASASTFACHDNVSDTIITV